MPGYNDLQTLRPEIIEEWDFKKNIKIKPTQVTIGSSKKVWWKCNSCGNEWEAPIYSRTKGRGCRKGAHKRKKLRYENKFTCSRTGAFDD